jgi:FkbM family methyltransferase
MRHLLRRALRHAGLDLRRFHAEPPLSMRLFLSLQEFRDSVSQAGVPARDFLTFCAQHIPESKSERFQDLLILKLTEEKRNGYFVDFGATDGVTINNSHLLENSYGWSGIVAEPCRRWHDELQRNRRCSIDLRCVWSKTGEHLEFNETPAAELATIAQFSDCDFHAKERRSGELYSVETVSLNDLLLQHRAPHLIDYLSIDTEGSEFDILSAFDFDAHDIRIITVEHNYTTMRARIHDLLTANKYRRLLKTFHNGMIGTSGTKVYWSAARD